MKELKDLIQDIASIQAPPVSEEALGAYIEGHLAGAELRDLQNILNSDDDFLRRFNAMEEYEHSTEKQVATPGFEVEVPPIIETSESSQTLLDAVDNIADTSFAFNGESIFDIDYSLFDNSDSPITHPHPVGINPLSKDSEMYNHIHNDIIDNTNDPSI